MGSGGIRDELITARRDTFYAALQTNVLLSLYIGRSCQLTAEDIDQSIPEIDHEVEFEPPTIPYRSSSFHFASKLILIASRMASTVYALKPNISLAARQAAVPELHLALESWYHTLSGPLRAATTTVSKAPHPHIIALNLLYHLIVIQLHRPFFRRFKLDNTQSVSTEKCLAASKHVVRLVKLQRESHGLRYVSPLFQHACFCAGTILAVAAVEEDPSATIGTPAYEKFEARRTQARMDLTTITSALRDVGATWTTAHTSADVLEGVCSFITLNYTLLHLQGLIHSANAAMGDSCPDRHLRVGHAYTERDPC